MCPSSGYSWNWKGGNTVEIPWKVPLLRKYCVSLRSLTLVLQTYGSARPVLWIMEFISCVRLTALSTAQPGLKWMRKWTMNDPELPLLEDSWKMKLLTNSWLSAQTMPSFLLKGPINSYSGDGKQTANAVGHHWSQKQRQTMTQKISLLVSGVGGRERQPLNY